jgi:hypothetical protein
MKKYLLLRDNRQSGPFSLGELRALQLGSKDLVWVEEESTCWCYPSEMEELKDFISEEKKVRKGVFVSRPVPNNIAPSESSFPKFETRSQFQPIEEEELPPVKGYWKKDSGKSNRSLAKNILSVTGVFCGLVLGAYTMKKAVDGFDKPTPVENVPLTVIADETPRVEIPSSAVQNALQVIPAEKKGEKIVRPARPKEIKKQLAIKANNYTVGMLGGISNLQLKVYNGSPHPIDRINIAIQYLKPNGSVIETDNYVLYSLKPFSTKLLAVPDTRRGVKVKYQILDVKSKDYNNAIKQV